MKIASIEALVRGLHDAGVPFIVVGGLAVVAHGYGRQTQVLDLVIRLDPDSIRAAFSALATLGYRPRVPVTADAFADPQQRGRITDKGMRVLITRKLSVASNSEKLTGIVKDASLQTNRACSNFHSDRHRETPVDVFVSEPFDFGAEYASAKIEQLAPGALVRVLRLETLLRLKQEAGRPQDLADIAELKLIHRKDHDV